MVVVVGVVVVVAVVEVVMVTGDKVGEPMWVGGLREGTGWVVNTFGSQDTVGHEGQTITGGGGGGGGDD